MRDSHTSSKIIILQFLHYFIISFPLYHPHFCNTSFSTDWNWSPPQPASPSESARGVTQSITPLRANLGAMKIPDLAVRNRDEHPELTLGGGWTLAPSECHFSPSLSYPLPPSSKIRDPHRGDARGRDATLGCPLGAQREGPMSCESLPAEAAFGPWVPPGHSSVSTSLRKRARWAEMNSYGLPVIHIKPTAAVYLPMYFPLTLQCEFLYNRKPVEKDEFFVIFM